MSNIKDFLPLWGQWYIEKEIGKGSFGTVYRAIKRDGYGTYLSAVKHIQIPSKGTTVADLISEGIIPNEESAGAYYESLSKKIINEINICYSVKGNSNIVSYEEHLVVPRAGNKGYDLFIRMEYLKPLNDYIAENGATEENVIRLGIDICQALMLLEKKGIMHRDIKPGNIFVNDDGTFKIGDFGESKHLNNANVSKIAGTYHYMAPEVVNSQPVNRTADIYSLGIVMYKLLNNNRLPFVSADKEIVTPDEIKRANRQRLNGAKLYPPKNASKELADIILKACEFSSGNRWQSAEALKKVLIAYSERKRKHQQYSFDDDKTIGRDNREVMAKRTVKNNKILEYDARKDAIQNYNYTKQSDSQEATSKGVDKTLVLVLIICLLILAILGSFFALLLSSSNSSQSGDDEQDNTESVTEASEIQIATEPITYIEEVTEITTGVTSEHPTQKTPKPSPTEPKKTSTVILPSYYNQSYETASSNIKSMGLEVKAEYLYSDTVSSGKVIKQDYSPGTALTSGTVVKLYVSLGAEGDRVTNSTEYVYADTYSYLTLRAGNGISTEPVAFLPSGTKLELLEKYDTMYKVRTYNGDMGYVNKDYVVSDITDYQYTGFGTPLSGILYPWSTHVYAVKDGLNSTLYSDVTATSAIKEMKSGDKMYVIELGETKYVHVVLFDSSSGLSEGYIDGYDIE